MTLDEIYLTLLKCEHDPKEFFGSDPDHKLREMLKISHPDRFTDKTKAHDYFTRFSLAYNLLKVKPVSFILNKRKVELYTKPIIGDTSDVYIEKDCVVKVGRLNALSVEFGRNEISTLSKITDSHYKKYIPTIVESQKQVTIFKKSDDFTLLSDLKDIPGVHITWIARRLMELVGYIHTLGICHNGILPSNILVFKKTHGIQLLDWKFAGLKDFKKSKKWSSIYPTEQVSNTRTDIHMLFKTLLSVYSNDNKYITGFMESCAIDRLSMINPNVWDIYDEFDVLRNKIFGKPKFVEWK